MTFGGAPVRSPHRSTRLVAWLAATLILGAASVVRAQAALAADAAAMESLRVPGGVANLLAQAELDRELPRTRAVRDLVRVIFDAPDETNPTLDARRERVMEYLRALSALEAVAAGFRGAVPPPQQAENKAIRQQLERLAEALGGSLERSAGRYRVQLDHGAKQTKRRQLLEAAGFSSGSFVEALNTGTPVRLELPSDTVPLPLPRATWLAVLRVPDEYGGSLATAILGDRNAALMYYGLLGVDAETRSFLAKNTELLREILQSNRAPVFASCGSSLVVVKGRIAVPGGAAAEPLWESLVGAPVTDAVTFASRLFDKDGGRLALFYHSLAFMDAPHLRFALGPSARDAADRMDRFRKLYEASAQPLAGWNPIARPFSRTRFDLARLLAITPVDADGRLGALSPARFWRKALADGPIPDNAPAELDRLMDDGAVDAASMVELLVGPSQHPDRSEAWALGHRVFRATPVASLPDVLVVMRAFPRYRVVIHALDRMGVTDPAVYAGVVRRAERLALVTDRRRAAVALGLFQGALALVERARVGRVVDAPTASALVRELANAGFSDDGESFGSVRQWLTGAFLPALANGLPAAGGPAPASLELLVLSASAGRTLSMADSPDLGVTIEGLPFRVDPAAADLARFRAIRLRQNSLSLDAVLAFGIDIDALLARDVTVGRLPGLTANLDRAFKAATKGGQPSPSPWFDADEAARAVGRALADLRKITKPQDLAKLLKITRPLLSLADGLLAHVLVSMAYTPHLGDPEGPALLAGDPSIRHDWGLGAGLENPRVPSAWRLPVEERGGTGWHLEGALLGLDVALCGQALRRVVTDKVPGPPTISMMDAQSITESVALAVPFDYSDADRAVIVDAIRRGRSRVEDLAREASAWPSIADRAGIRDVRREVMPWTLVHEPGRVLEMFSRGELLRLGLLPGGAVKQLDAWGTSGRAFDGRWSLRYPPTQPFELAPGRKGSAFLIVMVPDLALAVAEALYDKGLPAVLTRGVLSAAAQDFADDLRQSYDDDWFAMIALVPALMPRVDDYVAALTAGGGLVSVSRHQ